ncbi:DUF5590 domain-containing protein [Paenibacillus polygoni]|uniref:DUF5590 domain-containing protein n=1 Tax=Paenibacillus polygoni TaxID=3050112 RepID=A0ABY8X0W9_9BACL|nr:DUF5590 domain-containing protein [Paenibacillus polygoni]WIV17918.1 DUF5590 domain-containing protein [Paenibacillus polygoni]
MRRNRKKWIYISILTVLLILFGIYQFYVYVMKDQWAERDLAVSIAEQQAQLTSVTKTQKSVWGEESIYWTIEGTNSESKPIMVWVRFGMDHKPVSGKNSVHTELIENSFSEDEMYAKIAAELGNIEIIHLHPSYYNKTYVWQLFYKQDGKYVYRFYQFSDGTEIGNGYQLPD